MKLPAGIILWKTFLVILGDNYTTQGGSTLLLCPHMCRPIHSSQSPGISIGGLEGITNEK